MVIQALFLFGADNWVMLVQIAQRLEGVYVGFLRQVKKLNPKRIKDGSWQKVTSDRVLQGEGTKLIQTYLEIRQATVVEWVALQTIFEVCARDVGYEGGGFSGSHGGDRRQRRNS